MGALLGVVAPEADGEADIDDFVADFQAGFTSEAKDAGDTGGPALSEVVADGRTIRIARAGAGGGVPVVLIHGFAGDLDNWLFTSSRSPPSPP